MSDYDRQTFVYSEAARERNRISFALSSVARHIAYSFRILHTFSALYFSFYIPLSYLRARKRAAIHQPPPFEHCRGLIGSYRAVMSHNGADNARDNTPSASRLSGPLSPGTSTAHLYLLSSTSLLESAHPRQLNKHNS